MKLPSATPHWRKSIWPIGLAGALTWGSGQTLPHWGEPQFGSDKVIHFLLFGLLANWVGRSKRVQRIRPLGIYNAVVIVSLFGAIDEVHQHFTPGRSMDIFDWSADTLGAVFAIALYARWPRYRETFEGVMSKWFDKSVQTGGLKSGKGCAAVVAPIEPAVESVFSTRAVS
jgi:hypothetical protein